MRGTFVFPADDTDLMQQLEMAANNGAVEDVETVYVLAGSTYFVPEDLFALDDPSLYEVAEPHHVRTDMREVVRTVDEFYNERSGPKMVTWFHTHPSGRSRPSDGDYEAVEDEPHPFARQFDDCEFFQGIHALGQEATPDPEWMRVPRQTGENEVSWWGENRKHSLSVYDGQYEPRPMVVTTAAEMQHHLQQQQTDGGPQPGPEPEPEPEPGGEIWD